MKAEATQRSTNRREVEENMSYWNRTHQCTAGVFNLESRAIITLPRGLFSNLQTNQRRLYLSLEVDDLAGVDLLHGFRLLQAVGGASRLLAQLGELENSQQRANTKIKISGNKQESKGQQGATGRVRTRPWETDPVIASGTTKTVT